MYFSTAVVQEIIEGIAPYLHIKDVEAATATLFQASRPQKMWQWQMPPVEPVASNSGKCHEYATHKCAPGLVYLMQCGDLVKIGKTRSGIPERVKGIKSQFKLSTVPFYALESICYHGLELHLHQICRDSQIAGEFFRLDPDDLRYIQELAYWNQCPIRHWDIAQDCRFWVAPQWEAELRLSAAPRVPRAHRRQVRQVSMRILEAVRLLSRMQST